MNVVIIMTDTQNKDMIGPYGDNPSLTPNLDNLSENGITFENAYTACPVCTPARGTIFSGLYPQINGAICNNVSPFKHVPLMGKIFKENGYRAAYTGKWHLDGSAYFGDGIPGGGFESDWWYDGKKYAEEIGAELFEAYQSCTSSDELRKYGFTRDKIWGHRVAERAIDFLKTIGDEKFLLVCSFDEPHGPFIAPPEYWDKITADKIRKPANYNAPVHEKTKLAQTQRKENGEVSWEDFSSDLNVQHWHGCNNFIDEEIGRVVDMVKDLHGDDTMIIYTSDHGDQKRAHGLVSKGPMMYEETTNIPFIVHLPESAQVKKGKNFTPVSHVDIIPTILDYCAIEIPESLNGQSLKQTLEDNSKSVHDYVLLNFHRFAINHDSYGGYFPIRGATNGTYKLIINLHDHDEFYDLERDPFEKRNLICDAGYERLRDTMHDWILSEMNRIRDPYRSWIWGNREWRRRNTPFYHNGKKRPKPRGFSFENTAQEA